jgi:hypothetical protein
MGCSSNGSDGSVITLRHRALQTIGPGYPCFNCGCPRHFAQDYHQLRQGYSPRAPTPPRIQQKGHICTSTPKISCTNFTTVEDIPACKEVVAGTYYLCEHPIVILFNFGASHDFMSVAYAQKTNLSLEKTEVPCLILTPGGQVVAGRIICKIPLELAGQVFPTNLLILKAHGIDIILGMRWMKMHKALLDIFARLVHLDSPHK